MSASEKARGKNGEDMAEISIIVPVYKTEPYLCRCVDSLLAQTFGDFDLVLIDDGSPDGCGEICDAYARQDLRVHVIHQENGGLSAARNAGLDWAFANSESRWVSFVDSDDWVHPKYLEALLGAAQQYNVEVSICGFVRTFGEPLPEEMPCAAAIWTPEAYYSQNPVNATVSWGKLYGKSCFQRLRFLVGKINEDEFTTYRILFQFDHIAVIESVLYAYFQNDFGIMRGSWTPRRLDALEAMEQQVAYFLHNGYGSIARSRFFSLIRNSQINRDCLVQCEALTDAEKRIFINRINRRLRRILLRYRRYGWLPYRASEWNKRVYRQAFPRLAAAQRRWWVLKELLKRCPPTHAVGMGVKRLWRCLSILKRVIGFSVRSIGCQAILLQIPEHGNLGDHAIALAERQMLKALNIRVLEYPHSRGIERYCAWITTSKKLILIHGGGYLGQLWPGEEKRFQATIAAFSRNPVIVFPQTVYFDLDTEAGQRCFEASRAAYTAHPNLTIFLRERYSRDFMREYMPEVHVELVPDMVMGLEMPVRPVRREGLLICLRRDKEKTLLEAQRERIISIARARFDKVVSTDTVEAGNITLNQRETRVKKKLEEFASARMVITDRLHGMVFAVITQTPCIVLNSLSHKLRGCYEWLGGLDYIRFADNIDELQQVMDELSNVLPEYDQTHVIAAMQPLRDAIQAAVKGGAYS